MTSVVRYVQNTSTDTNVNVEVGSTGKDYQLVAFDVTTVRGIAAEADAHILTWTGSGQIKAILSVFIRDPNGDVILSGDGDNAHSTRITLDAAQKTLTIAIPAEGTPIPANSVISLLLVIGNY